MGIHGPSGCRTAGSEPLYGNRQPLDYVRVDPTLVVDVQVEAAAHDGWLTRDYLPEFAAVLAELPVPSNASPRTGWPPTSAVPSESARRLTPG